MFIFTYKYYIAVNYFLKKLNKKYESNIKEIIYKYINQLVFFHVISNYISKFNYIDIYCKYIKINKIFIEQNKNVINWDELSLFGELSEELIEKYNDKINWFLISTQHNLSENFIKKNIDKLNLYNILSNQKLSENFLDDYYSLYLNNKKNDNNILNELKILNLNLNISLFQNLSLKFIKKYKNTLIWECLSQNENINIDELTENFIDKIEWDIVASKRNLSLEYIKKYIDKLPLEILLSNNKISSYSKEVAYKLYKFNVFFNQKIYINHEIKKNILIVKLYLNKLKNREIIYFSFNLNVKIDFIEYLNKKKINKLCLKKIIQYLLKNKYIIKKNIFEYVKLDKNFWLYISNSIENASNNFILEYIDYLNWDVISKIYSFNEEMLILYKYKINWIIYLSYHLISIDFFFRNEIYNFINMPNKLHYFIKFFEKNKNKQYFFINSNKYLLFS